MDRKEWIKGLKKGDKVVDKKYYGRYNIFTIKNITPKGKIRLEEKSNILLDENGRYHKFENWNSTDIFIEPYTEEIEKKMKDAQKRRELINKYQHYIKLFNEYKVSNDILKKLIKILEEVTEN